MNTTSTTMATCGELPPMAFRVAATDLSASEMPAIRITDAATNLMSAIEHDYQQASNTAPRYRTALAQELADPALPQSIVTARAGVDALLASPLAGAREFGQLAQATVLAPLASLIADAPSIDTATLTKEQARVLARRAGDIQSGIQLLVTELQREPVACRREGHRP